MKKIRRSFVAQLRQMFHTSILVADAAARACAIALGVTLVFGLFSARAQAQAIRAANPGVPIEDFFRLPDVLRPVLSPDGNHMAFLARAGTRLGLAVIDLEKRSSQIIATLPQSDVVEFYWVNSKRLVFVSGNVQDAGGGPAWRTGGLFAVDRDGSDARRLALPFGDGSAVVMRPRLTRYLSSLTDGTDDIIVASNDRAFDSTDAYRLNTRTARKTLLTFDNPGDVVQWVIDREGVPRAAISQKGTRTRVSYRRDDKSPWVVWTDGDFRDPVPAPITVGYDGAIIGLGYPEKITGGANNSRMTAALVQLSDRGQIQQMLASRADTDVTQAVFDPVAKKLVGARSFAERQNTIWFDDTWASVQKQIDQQLAGAVNVFTPPDQANRMLVLSFSDQNPGTVYLLDLRTRKLERVIDLRPWIKSDQMAESRIVKFAARDELPLSALVTTPRGVPARNLPTVVLVHGGPWVDGYSWRWNAEAQFLASRGYAVIQPNFRGTLGFGLRHLLASFKQWGLAMQDDITDAAQWAVKQGISDPKRMCIYGASYGGYSALQGLVRTPELFQCGVSYVGMSDLQLAHSITWSDSSDSDFNRFLFPVMVGDPEKDRAQLRATSPLQNASKIKGAVMIVHGGEDRRVPIAHAERMKTALEREGKTVDWLVKTDEGHGFTQIENRVEFYTRMEAFIRRNLGAR
jgi:dipeptidyl aminopeptidase/acylaminoacyl peptidase